MRYSRTEHFARAILLGRFSLDRPMAMYTAYFDESGHPDDDGAYLVVAGCVAETGQWDELEREWLEVLKPLGTRVFHTADFDCGAKPFDRLKEAQADELFARLIGIICRRINKSFSHVIPLGPYRAMNGKYLLGESYGFPYPAAARHCIFLVSEWAERHSIPPGEILHFFEDGAKHKGQLRWVALRDNQPEPNFKPKEEIVALQAADVLAWCSNLYLTKRANIKIRYDRALARLSDVANEWGISRAFDDIDELPAILHIPLRNPAYRYKCQILKHRGRKRAVVHYWPANRAIEPSVNKKTLVLPDAPILNEAEIQSAKEEYHLAKRMALEGRPA